MPLFFTRGFRKIKNVLTNICGNIRNYYSWHEFQINWTLQKKCLYLHSAMLISYVLMYATTEALKTFP
uniref:Uncharacterized protein n=1 Tax=Rhodnius prolixus TaxID=13249 RepID=T1HGS7_RHOPR